MRGVAVSLMLGAGACGRIGFDSSGDDGRTADARVLPAGLVAWLPFDDDPSDGADVFGPDYAADAVARCDSTCPVAAPGKIGGAATFDGGGFLRLADTGSLRLAQGSFAAWIRPTSFPPTGESEVVVAKPFGPAMKDSYELFLGGGSPTIDIGGDSDTGGPYVVATYTPALATWVHVAATWDETFDRLYVDGTQIAEDVPFTKQYDASDVLVGGDIDSSSPLNFWLGDLDDLRIYDHALSPAEVQALATP